MKASTQKFAGPCAQRRVGSKVSKLRCWWYKTYSYDYKGPARGPFGLEVCPVNRNQVTLEKHQKHSFYTGFKEHFRLA